MKNVLSPVYVDAMVLRDRDTITGGGLEERLYAQHDANFNVTALVDASGTVAQRYLYDAYGSQTVLTATWNTSTDAYGFLYGHQGGRYDPTTGLYHFNNGGNGRDYSPTLGRWLEVDRHPDGPYVDGMNGYEYVKSSPNNLLDPQGLTVNLGDIPNLPLGNFACAMQVQNQEFAAGKTQAPAGWKGWNDTWAHCYLGCMVGVACGTGTSALLAVLKEAYDKVTGGDASARDTYNTLIGMGASMGPIGDLLGLWCVPKDTVRDYCTLHCQIANKTSLDQTDKPGLK